MTANSGSCGRGKLMKIASNSGSLGRGKPVRDSKVVPVEKK